LLSPIIVKSTFATHALKQIRIRKEALIDVSSVKSGEVFNDTQGVVKNKELHHIPELFGEHVLAVSNLLIVRIIVILYLQLARVELDTLRF
jgi:hypothetical protein